MTANLLLANSYLALSALAPASASAAAVDHPRNTAPHAPTTHHIVHPTPLVSLTPSSVRLRAERTDAGVSLTLA